MNEDISLDDIRFFEDKYNIEKNKKIEKEIKKYGLKKACLNDNDYKYFFNLELPEVKIYNQYNSHQCNIYAFLRVVKDIMRKNTDLNIDDLDISANYIAFFDKLEKINVLYNELINLDDVKFQDINKLVDRYIGSFGTFHSCKQIVNKYGLVLSKDMKEVDSKYDDNLSIELLQEKIKIDALSFIKLELKEKIKQKKELLYEAYQFLSKIYGNPPSEFEFKNQIMTPVQFKNTYLKDELNDFVTVTSLDKKDLLASYSYIPNIYLNDDEEIITLKQSEISTAIINQIKDGISIWFSSEESTKADYENSILDDKSYKFEKMLNIKSIKKEEKIVLNIINYDHAMCITGILVEDCHIKQLKVDNSFGNYGKYNGHFIMTPTFLENCVITLIMSKKNIYHKD